MTWRPRLRFMDDATTGDVVAEAKKILAEVGILVEHPGARDLLLGAGARAGGDGRVRIGTGIVERAIATAPSEFFLHDRDGSNAVRIGGDAVSFNPGSAATMVLDHGEIRSRPATSADCERFSALAGGLPHLALQSTCVVPSDVPAATSDLYRLGAALMGCRKPVVTGVFVESSLAIMREMLACVRGSDAALRDKPLAVFDCCPTSPLEWGELACATLIGCARHGLPAEIISVPMTGATSPVTLLGALAQQAAETLSGIAIHQLASPGAPLVYGSCASAFDMRRGTSALGAAEAMMMNAGAAQIGKSLNLPTHAYMALSDAKRPDYQAGLESGWGALIAALSGINIVSGAGMMEFAACQSLEKLVLDHEACAMAARAARGMERRDDSIALEWIAAAMPDGQFLKLRHTRRWYREEVMLPGPVIDREIRDAWIAGGAGTSADRAHAEVERLLAAGGAPALEGDIESELRRLMRG